MANPSVSPTVEFPCSLTVDVPFPTARLASVALRALSVDKELSPHVRRAFSTVVTPATSEGEMTGEEESVLRTEYKATTNRMLRVAVNSFMDSLSLVLEVMEQLDTDILEAKRQNSQDAVAKAGAVSCG